MPLDEGRPLLLRPHELKFRAHREHGVLETGISGFLEGTEERRLRAPYFQWVLPAEGRGRTVGGPRGERGAPAGEAGAAFPRKVCAPRPARRRPRRARTAPVPARAHGLQRVARPARRGGGPRAAVRDCALGSPPSPVGLGGTRNTPLSRRRGRPGAPRKPCARPHPPARRGCGAFSRRLGPRGRLAAHRGSLPTERRRPGYRLRADGLARGGPGAEDQPEPPLVSLAAAATAAAPAAACSAVAAMPARGGERAAAG